jgi:hypothetical protein
MQLEDLTDIRANSAEISRLKKTTVTTCRKTPFPLKTLSRLTLCSYILSKASIRTTLKSIPKPLLSTRILSGPLHVWASAHCPTRNNPKSQL